MKVVTNSTSIIKNVSRTDVTTYIEQSGSTINVYTQTNNGNWSTQQIDSSSNQANVLQLITLCLNSIQNLDMSDDEVDGISAYKINGTIDAASMEQIVNQSGLANGLLGGSTNLDLSGIYDGLNDMNLTLWIDKDTFYPFQYTMDMTEISSRILQKMKDAGVSLNGVGLSNVAIKTYNITGKLNDFNNAADSDVPSDAKS
jgi:hypothetical protein